MAPYHLFDKNRAGDFVSKNSTYSANIIPNKKKIQIQMAYDNDM
jgi:hypothetical protein